ncbi:sure-like protein [Melanomma pulvis-pyrius CBS 109.77]|uniref:Sure-like protein n=1 Tax=Melanomma pulvis-pyrius CBS 109.77 TaxID=1314802 RepID=A0A6A6X9E2_9PLEO|nr:sure-like protein [Melanomma pulvis-pyrius CBS 109.77]
MRVSIATALTTALGLAQVSSGIKILMNNDDGFGGGNIRELYRLLKGAGHDVIIVAPAVQQSGQGGRTDFTTSPNLTAPTQYNIIPAGAPSLGTDPNDSNIWYYNGTPAACTFVALDYVLPNFYPDWTGAPDLFLSGPNYGVNLGAFVYSLSGTLGATYAAIARSIPGIALSASNKALSYKDVTNTSNPATWAATVSFKVVEQFIDNTGPSQPILPLGYGVNVNIPPLTSAELPPVVKTRMTGEAEVDYAAYNETSGLFTWENLRPRAAGVNACYNGDCSLPGETYVVGGGGVSVSVFTIDYDAPSVPYTEMVFEKAASLFEGAGGGDGNGTYKAKRHLTARRELFVGRDLKD